MRRLLFVTAGCLAAAACSIPRDPSGTTDRVERTHVLRLGVVQSERMGAPGRRTLDRLLDQTHARLQSRRGDGEHLLADLEEGKLDLVYGRFAKSSPWKTSVHFSTAQGRLGKPPKGEAVPRFAMMNGENGWIVKVEKASK